MPLKSYDDVRAILDTALAHDEPLTYELPSESAAARWRFRANKFKARTEVEVYRTLELKITKEAPCTIIIARRAEGVLRTLEGKRVEPAVELSPEEREAEALAKELGL